MIGRAVPVDGGAADRGPIRATAFPMKGLEPWVFCELQSEADMGIDDLLIAIIIAGTGLSGVYLHAQYVSWRRFEAAERRRQFSLRELYANPVCDKKMAHPYQT